MFSAPGQLPVVYAATGGADPNANYGGVENGRNVWDKVLILLNSDTWLYRTDAARAQILLHELGHVFNFLAGAGGSDFVDELNPDGTVDNTKEEFNHDLEKKCIP